MTTKQVQEQAHTTDLEAQDLAYDRIVQRVKANAKLRNELDPLLKKATLPDDHQEGLSVDIECETKGWLNSSGAALYCLLKTNKSEVNWHSRLSENRRTPTEFSSVSGKTTLTKGNVDRFGELRYFRFMQKVYYRAEDLDDWLKNPLNN
jgi:hypothetical protein